LLKYAIPVLLTISPLALAKPPKKPVSVSPQEKTRVFVGESEAFVASSFGVASPGSRSSSAVQSSSAGMEKWTVYVMKDLSDNCPNVIVVNQPDKADYFLRLDRNGVLVRLNAMAVFNRAGEMVFVGAGARLTKQVKKFCDGIPYKALTAAPTSPGEKAP
jgi:hypothetical protein